MSSERVRLEVAILAADETLLDDAPPPHDGEAVTILVIAADANVRSYVQECLRGRMNVRVVTAGSVSDALTAAARTAPHVLVVDAPQSEILMTLGHVRAVLLVDETPHEGRRAESRVRFLGRPFTAARLMAELDEISRIG